MAAQRDTEWFQDRQARRQYRRNARTWGVKVPKLQTVAQVETDAIPIPAWAREKAIRGLAVGTHSVWLGRMAATLLIRLDREAGGEPKVTWTVYRRCGQCDRALLGMEAEDRWNKDREFAGKHIPCGPDCIETAQAQKRPVGRPKGS